MLCSNGIFLDTKPQERETEQDYVSRFMADAEMQKEYPEQDQRSAVAYAQWRTEGMANGTNDYLKGLNYPLYFGGAVMR